MCDAADVIDLANGGHRNPEFVFCVMWKASVPVGQLIVLQEGGTLGWLMKELSITFWQGELPLVFRAFRQTPGPATCSICYDSKTVGSGRKPLIPCLVLTYLIYFMW
jgi:hypothetical protein